MRCLHWLIQRLSKPRAYRWVIAVALGLTLPSLLAGLFIDEYVQLSKWQQTVGQRGLGGIGEFLNDCYVFISGDPTLRARELKDEVGAWWAAPTLKVAFWRPLSAATLALDYALWPTSAARMHLQTLAWFMALLAALHGLYRRLLAPRVAALALALYAWDDARGIVLSWIAKRNAIIAALFGVCAILAYERWRRNGWRLGAWLAPVLLGCSLLASEMGIATTGFLFAFALTLDTGSLPRRLGRLLPHAFVVITWHVIYSQAGYGARAPGFQYVHPLTDPVTFTKQFFVGAPLLALGQLTPVPGDLVGGLSLPYKAGFSAAAVALVCAVGSAAWPRLAHDARWRYWLLSSGLALVPIAASGPTEQNLVFVGMGVSPALAMTFSSFVERASALRWHRVLLGTLAVCNLVLAPLLLPVKCLAMLGTAYLGKVTNESVPTGPTVAARTLVVVAAPSEGHLYFVRKLREVKGLPHPRLTRVLVTTAAKVAVTRLDSQTLRVVPEGGYFASPMHSMYNDPARPLRKGDVVAGSDMTATVVEVNADGRPSAVEFRFASALESPEWLWMCGEGLRVVDWRLPRVGETVLVQ